MAGLSELVLNLIVQLSLRLLESVTGNEDLYVGDKIEIHLNPVSYIHTSQLLTTSKGSSCLAATSTTNRLSVVADFTGLWA